MHHTHQPTLVAFSIVIAILASYTALELAVSIVEQMRRRFAWIAAGAVAQGTGIWSMHFVGMLALTIPGVQIRYDIPLVIVSYSIAIAGSCLALYAASRREMTRTMKVVCTLAMAAAIGGLHYTAVAAMRMPVDYDWNYLLVVASVAIAIVASGAGLWLSIEFRSDLSIRGFFTRAGAAVVLGGAICGMHYTGMAAMVSWRHGAIEPAPGGVLATPALATLVIGASHLILGIAIAGCGVNRALALGRQRTKTGEALDALRARDEFLSIAAHELHTPVHSLQLVVQGARSGMLALTPDRMTRAFRVVERQARRLTDLVDSLLDVSRIQQGRLDLRFDDVDLVAIVEDLVEQLADDISAAGCTVSVRKPRGPVLGRWDRRCVEQVVVNLLTNAIKFGRGAPIDITIEEAGGVARLVVEDHGIGIPEDRLRAIFERFERAVPAEQYGGLGLGLYIVKSVVDMMGGSVEARSRVGMGSTFVLTLPFGARRAP